MMYDRIEQGAQEGRVKPAQARHIRWSDVCGIVCMRVDRRTCKPTLVQVCLNNIHCLRRWGPGLADAWLTKAFYLRPSTRNDKLRPIVAMMKMEQRWIPLLMGTHGRLGDQSLVGGLDADLARLVCRFV